MPDMIDYKLNGYLAKPFDTRDLAVGINWVLSNENPHEDLCVTAKEKAVESFDLEKVAMQCAELYWKQTA
jgi:glycosyltransferase involved in cell wall biosynthesis